MYQFIEIRFNILRNKVLPYISRKYVTWTTMHQCTLATVASLQVATLVCMAIVNKYGAKTRQFS